ncbi:MAG TPA: hypothetical protein VFN49_09695 [Candidatus Aquilonibacter sp.]|nr:hypothetical protein [Candidatus Aquilonibacter sp.]
MPKRILAFAFAAGALALAACSSTNPNDLFGSATPTPGPTATYTPNPTASTANVQINYSGSGLANQPVNLSTPDANGNVGATIATQTTNSTGQTTFSNLTPAAKYCFASTFQPTPAPSASPSPAPLPRTVSTCTDLWGLTGVTITLNF